MTYLLQVNSQGFFTLENIAIIGIVCQFAIALSVLKIWVIKYKSIVADFKEFKLPDWIRKVIGTSKLLLCVALIVGIWINWLAIYVSIIIGILMIGAIFAHYYAGHTFKRSFEAVLIFILCVIVAYLNIRFHYQDYYMS